MIRRANITTHAARKPKTMMIIIAAVAFITASAVLYFSTDGLSNFGAGAQGARLERMKQSPNFDGKKFVSPVETNLSPTFANTKDMLYRWVAGSHTGRPEFDIPVVALGKTSFETPPRDGLRVTWMGHSTALIEIDGRRILTDPMWGERSSPSSIVGPKRFHPPPISLADLPALDAVLISHDHFDHLDQKTVRLLAKTGVSFYVPLGVGAHLAKWGIDPSQIAEMDWWDKFSADELQIVATPARHFSGRNPFAANGTLWTSFAIIGPKHRVFFGGDSGPFPGFAEIGERYGPFDITMLEIGAYDRTWPDVHLNPENAVGAHLALRGDLLLPIHYGTFNLALHNWFEPPAWLHEAAMKRGVRHAIPLPGQSVTATDPPPVDPWWTGVEIR
jgi:L-ascorbate metabolism protein UlaG (beta-lactamase superfamily)